MIADSFFTKNPNSALIVQVMQNGTILTDEKILPHGVKDFEFNQIPTATYRVRAFLSINGSGNIRSRRDAALALRSSLW